MSDFPDFVIQDKNGFVPELLLRGWNRVIFRQSFYVGDSIQSYNERTIDFGDSISLERVFAVLPF